MRRTRRLFLTHLAGVLCAAAVLWGAQAAEEPAFPVSPLTIETGRGRYQLMVEMAETPSTWRQGLQKRRQLAPDAGMLFNYQQPRAVTMWMKDTFISLDMIFIDERGLVVNIVENTQPMSLSTIPSEGPVLAVLELNAGTAAKLGLKRGDRIVHAIFVPMPAMAPAPG